MGVKGAAIATAISIMTGGFMALGLSAVSAKTLRLIPLKISPTSIRLGLRNIGYQCKIGSSSLLGELIMAVFHIRRELAVHALSGRHRVGAFGIACYYAPFFFMIGNAIAQSAQPIISYNFGAERPLQVVRRVRCCCARQ